MKIADKKDPCHIKPLAVPKNNSWTQNGCFEIWKRKVRLQRWHFCCPCWVFAGASKCFRDKIFENRRFSKNFGQPRWSYAFWVRRCFLSLLLFWRNSSTCPTKKSGRGLHIEIQTFSRFSMQYVMVKNVLIRYSFHVSWKKGNNQRWLFALSKTSPGRQWRCQAPMSGLVRNGWTAGVSSLVPWPDENQGPTKRAGSFNPEMMMIIIMKIRWWSSLWCMMMMKM